MPAEIVRSVDLDGLRHVAEDLRSGATAIAQTDTNYGVFCSPFSRSACDRLYEMKRRDGAKPLTLFVSAADDWQRWAYHPVEVNMDALTLAFWPGPLNIILKKKQLVPDWVTSGKDSVSVVHNASPVVNLMSVFSGLPLAATSANISGTMDAGLVDFQLAYEHIGASADYIIQSDGPPQSTMSSTILSLDGIPRIVRQGDLTEDAIRKIVPSLA